MDPSERDTENLEHGGFANRWVWLLFLLFFVMGPLAYGSRRSLVETAVGLALFLPIYAWTVQRPGPRVVRGLAAMVLLGVVFCARNPGASVFFIYAAAMSPRLGDDRRAHAVVWSASGAAAVSALVLQPSPFFWVPAGVCTPVMGLLSISHWRLARAHHRLRRSQDEVARLAQVAERERIARDLHDLLGHTLSVIVLKSELAAKLLERGDARAGAEIREVERISRQTLQEVRSAVAGFRAHSLDAELAGARTALEAAGVELDARVGAGTDGDTELPPLHEGTLALALREAVTNVVRHAGARRCRIRLERDGGGVRLEVADDGHGGEAPEGAGLAGMRERLEHLGGRLERRVGDGTVLRAWLPDPGEPVEAAP